MKLVLNGMIKLFSFDSQWNCEKIF